MDEMDLDDVTLHGPFITGSASSIWGYGYPSQEGQLDGSVMSSLRVTWYC
jgi:hypothetical protein